MILCTFFKTNSWLNTYFKCLMCVTYSSYYACLLQDFQIFQFLLVKQVNHCEGYVTFQDIQHRLQENILHGFHHYSPL